MKIAILPGDGIGTEIVDEAVKVLKVLDLKFELVVYGYVAAAFYLVFKVCEKVLVQRLTHHDED